MAHASGDIDPPVGVFTTQNRTDWAKYRQQLIDTDYNNLYMLEKIQSALILVCLDNAAPSNMDEVSILCWLTNKQQTNNLCYTIPFLRFFQNRYRE